MSRIQANRVAFTLNNPDIEEYRNLEAALEDECVEYGILADEVGESGTLHIQGFMHIKGTREDGRKRGIRFWKGFLGSDRLHIERARGTDEQNQEYCSKDGVFIERGSPTKERGSVYAEFAEACKLGTEHATQEFPELTIKHWTYARDNAKRKVDWSALHAPETLFEWQVSSAFGATRIPSNPVYRPDLEG